MPPAASVWNILTAGLFCILVSLLEQQISTTCVRFSLQVPAWCFCSCIHTRSTYTSTTFHIHFIFVLDFPAVRCSHHLPVLRWATVCSTCTVHFTAFTYRFVSTCHTTVTPATPPATPTLRHCHCYGFHLDFDLRSHHFLPAVWNSCCIRSPTSTDCDFHLPCTVSTTTCVFLFGHSFSHLLGVTFSSTWNRLPPPFSNKRGSGSPAVLPCTVVLCVLSQPACAVYRHSSVHCILPIFLYLPADSPFVRYRTAPWRT